ncbi:MAG TPA: hypothetical protein VG942_18665 [Hyphomonadaceae bacterium]|nr:hypothetical protein [Hyphomonadaceae bacterium]
MPPWSIPSDLARLVAEDPDHFWHSESYEPIRLVVMGGTSYAGREIPLAWQIEFEPEGIESKDAEKTLDQLGLPNDGYGWAMLVATAYRKLYPETADELQISDTEAETCVIWVENETTCRQLMETIWLAAGLD